MKKMQRRDDEQYDKQETIEVQIAEWNSQLLSVRQNKKILLEPLSNGLISTRKSWIITAGSGISYSIFLRL